MVDDIEISNPPTRLPVVALFTANGISMVGTVMTHLAIPWFVLQTTGSAAKTGIVAFFIILPTVFAAFIGGPLVDRLGFRRSSIITDCACAITIGLIPLLYSAGLLEFWLLLVLVFIANLFETPGGTARMALLPDLAVRANMTMEQASSALQVIGRSSRLIGAPLAGLLIALLGPSQVLWLDAATFAVSAIIITVATPRTKIKPGKEKSESFWEEMVGGFTFIWQDSLIKPVVLVVMVTNLLDGAVYGVILPFYTKTFLGQALDMGLLIAVSGGGAVVGALIFGAFSKKLPQREIFLWGFVIIGIEYAALALVPPFWVLILAFTVGGIAAGPINPIMGAVIFNRVPANSRGRVISAITAGANVVTPIGVLGVGFILEQVDVRVVLAVMGIIYILVTSSLFFSRGIHELGKPVKTVLEQN
ncbi:MAG: hypothetical protein JWP00_886 [Chloroflexi bacterium]|nr:hypothetical protein [Chloroflexota bacterium]